MSAASRVVTSESAIAAARHVWVAISSWSTILSDAITKFVLQPFTSATSWAFSEVATIVWASRHQLANGIGEGILGLHCRTFDCVCRLVEFSEMPRHGSVSLDRLMEQGRLSTGMLLSRHRAAILHLRRAARPWSAARGRPRIHTASAVVQA